MPGLELLTACNRGKQPSDHRGLTSQLMASVDQHASSQIPGLVLQARDGSDRTIRPDSGPSACARSGGLRLRVRARCRDRKGGKGCPGIASARLRPRLCRGRRRFPSRVAVEAWRGSMGPGERIRWMGSFRTWHRLFKPNQRPAKPEHLHQTQRTDRPTIVDQGYDIRCRADYCLPLSGHDAFAGRLDLHWNVSSQNHSPKDVTESK